MKLIKQEGQPSTSITNAALTDPTISFKAKGLYGNLYSKPNDWEFSAKNISKEGTDKIKAVQSGLRELENAGWIARQKLASGKVNYIIYREKQKPENDDKKPNSQKGVLAVISNIVVIDNYLLQEQGKKEIIYNGESITISLNIYEAIVNFIMEQRKNIPGVNYQIEEKGYDKYLGLQLSEYIGLEREFKKFNVPPEMLIRIFDFIVRDSFWRKNIGSVQKLRIKNKEGMPYRVVILGRMKIDVSERPVVNLS